MSDRCRMLLWLKGLVIGALLLSLVPGALAELLAPTNSTRHNATNGANRFNRTRSIFDVNANTTISNNPTRIRGSLPTYDPVRITEEFSGDDNPTRGLAEAGMSPVVVNINSLPQSGMTARIPWPGHWWPAYQDSINYQWAGPGTISASKKYQMAFRPNENIEATVSSTYGIQYYRSNSQNRPCTSDNDCVAVNSNCGIRSGESSGICILSWAGLCHALAAASTMVPEPVRPVQINNVRFEVNDIKALVVLSHDLAGIQSSVIGSRCNLYSGSMNFDLLGRPTEQSCRDTNPASFHIAVANTIGIQRKHLIFDNVFDAAIWNYPALSYHVFQNVPISKEQARALMGIGAGTDTFSPRSTRFRYIENKVRYVSEAPASIYNNRYITPEVESWVREQVYKYILELDSNDNIIGGEWVGESKTLHPDFLWVPIGKIPNTEFAGIRWSDVQQLLQQSTN